MRTLPRLAFLAACSAILLAPVACAPAPAEEPAEEEHTPEELLEAEEEFKMIDTNEDGVITREEILAMEVGDGAIVKSFHIYRRQLKAPL